MKILLISASPRKNKSQTFALAGEILKGCNNADCEIIHLCDCNIKFCIHCERCHSRIMDCPLKDDVSFIMNRMLEADGLILASPNYINCVTASMKALFDRSTHFLHCKRLLGKYAVGVVSSGSGYDKPVIDYIKHYAFSCGSQFVDGVFSRVPLADEKKKIAVLLGKKLQEAIQKKKIFKGQMRIIEQSKQHFKHIVMARKKDWQEEYRYWKQQNWL